MLKIGKQKSLVLFLEIFFMSLGKYANRNTKNMNEGQKPPHPSLPLTKSACQQFYVTIQRLDRRKKYEKTEVGTKMTYSFNFINKLAYKLGKTHIKKCFFSGRTNPPYHYAKKTFFVL